LILSGDFCPILKAEASAVSSAERFGAADVSRKRGFPMGKITYQELLKDKRMRFAISIINSAYASDSLDGFEFKAWFRLTTIRRWKLYLQVQKGSSTSSLRCRPYGSFSYCSRS
jgi:hypothetical protein